MKPDTDFREGQATALLSIDDGHDVLDDGAVRSFAPKLAAHYRVMPVRLEGGVLTLAVSNPFDMSATEDIETNLGYRVERVLACSGDIAAAIRWATSGPGPVLLRVETQAGHGGGDQIKKSIELAADELSFLLHEVGLKVRTTPQ